jgi:hypothetical protein
MVPGLSMKSEMRNYILHIAAMVLGVRIHIEGFPLQWRVAVPASGLHGGVNLKTEASSIMPPKTYLILGA